MRHLIVALTLGLSAIAKSPAFAQEVCRFEQEPSILVEQGSPHDVGSRLLQIWEIENRPVYWSETTPDRGSYEQFRTEVAERVNETDPVLLLERSPTENNLTVIRNADEWIVPAGCMEKLMIGFQHARLNTFDDPSEFAGAILRSPEGDRLRVYYYTVNQDGLGRMATLVDPVLADRDDGWEVQVVLHSHVFHPGQPEIDGLLAPSEPDADFHVRFQARSNVEEAWITNGLHTVRIPASSFTEFRRPLGAPPVEDVCR